MPVSMEDVRRVLDPDEPDYLVAAELGADALPHLEELIAGDDVMLASKATYAASLMDGGAGAVATAAASKDPILRVAAAAGAKNLPVEQIQQMLRRLSDDDDDGVRKVARTSARR